MPGRARRYALAVNSYSDLAASTQQTTGAVAGIVFYVLLAVALWRVFSKAGWPGILALIPVVNLFVLVKIAGMSAWLGLLYLVPIVQVVFSIVVAFGVGKRFGRGGLFSFFLLWLFSIVGYFILGFGSATYRKTA